jgi:hypothetical protein
MEQDTDYSTIHQSTTAACVGTPEIQAVSPTPMKSPKFRLSFLGIKRDRDQQLAISPSPSLTEQLNQLNQSTGAVNENLAGKPKRITFDIPGSASENTRGKVEDLNRVNVGSYDALVPPSSPPLSPTSRSSPGFFAKLLEKKPRYKAATVDLPSAVAVSDTPGRESVDSPALVVTKQSPAGSTGNVIDVTTTVTEMERPCMGSRSPSTFEAAEKFVTESTKQLADWSEEAVSGVIKSTKSFTLMKTTTDSTEGDPAHLTRDDVTSDTGVSEEELDRNRTMDRRIIREISSIFGTGFYFSTEFNLLTSMQKRSDLAKTTPKGTLPLWQQVDGRFWWNEHLLKEFLDNEVLHSAVYITASAPLLTSSANLPFEIHSQIGPWIHFANNAGICRD